MSSVMCMSNQLLPGLIYVADIYFSVHVNGQPWPYLAVEPRKYLFRFLDTSVSRSFQLYAEADKKVGTRIPFSVIGSDAGLLASPVSTTQLDISMAERWEVVFDFSSYAGQNITLKNTGNVAADDDFDGTDRVMRFMVGNSVSDNTNNGPLPASLRSVPLPPAKTGVDRSYEFERSGGEWRVNGITWADVQDRVIAKPERGAVERWGLINSAGGWSHVRHIFETLAEILLTQIFIFSQFTSTSSTFKSLAALVALVVFFHTNRLHSKMSYG